MPRSRSGLLFFLGTFGASLCAVGFADGGHLSSARPADIYRLDVDDPADGLNTWCDSQLHETCMASAPALGSSAALHGSDGWIAVIMPGAPLVAALYIDEDTACRLACLPGPSVDPAPSAAALRYGNDPFAGCVFGPWAESSDRLVAAEMATTDACDELGWQDPERGVSAPGHVAPRDFEELMLLEIGAAYAGPLPSWLVWQYATQLADIREPAWSDCDRFPDGSLAGWLDEAQTLSSAHLWRAVGQAARGVVLQILEGRQAAITTVSRQIVGCLHWPLSETGQTASSPSAGTPGTWPNARSTGVFLAL